MMEAKETTAQPAPQIPSSPKASKFERLKGFLNSLQTPEYMDRPAGTLITAGAVWIVAAMKGIVHLEYVEIAVFLVGIGGFIGCWRLCKKPGNFTLLFLVIAQLAYTAVAIPTGIALTRWLKTSPITLSLYEKNEDVWAGPRFGFINLSELGHPLESRYPHPAYREYKFKPAIGHTVQGEAIQDVTLTYLMPKKLVVSNDHEVWIKGISTDDYTEYSISLHDIPADDPKPVTERLKFESYGPDTKYVIPYTATAIDNRKRKIRQLNGTFAIELR